MKTSSVSSGSLLPHSSAARFTPCLRRNVTICVLRFLSNLLLVPFVVTMSSPKTTLMMNLTPTTPLRGLLLPPTSPHLDIQSPVCAPRPDPVYHPVSVPPPFGDPPPVPADIVPLPPDPVRDCFQPPSAPLMPDVVEPPRRSGGQCKAPFCHSEDWVLK